MGIFSKFISQSIDNLYYLQAGKKTCGIFSENEAFEGHRYTPEEFYEKLKAFYNKPVDYYRDFCPPKGFNLSDGFHFNATDQAHTAKYGYTPYTFESPATNDWEENNLAPFRWFRNENKKSKVLLLFSPGWARPNLNLEKRFCAQLMKGGIDAGLMTMPLHQERAPAGSYSGEYFLSNNLFWTTSNFRHYVAEIRLLIQYMRAHYDYVGLIGMSAGGFPASLAANVEEIDFYFPFITGANLGSMIWESKITTFIKQDLIRKGIDEGQANKVLSICDQLYLGQHLKAAHVKQYISLYDKVVPTKYQFMLWEIYNRPEKLELQCAHISFSLFMPGVADDIVKYVAGKI